MQVLCMCNYIYIHGVILAYYIYLEPRRSYALDFHIELQRMDSYYL